jgi:esterase/lipase
MKNDYKLMAEHIGDGILLHFKGLTKKSAIKMIKTVESTAAHLVKKFQKLLEDDSENLDDSEKKEAKEINKELKKQKKAIKKADQKAKIAIVTLTPQNDDVIQESGRMQEN